MVAHAEPCVLGARGIRSIAPPSACGLQSPRCLLTGYPPYWMRRRSAAPRIAARRSVAAAGKAAARRVPIATAHPNGPPSPPGPFATVVEPSSEHAVFPASSMEHTDAETL